MKDIKIICTKRGGLRAYYWAMRHFRWFPMPLADAQHLIRVGQARDVTANKAYTCVGIKGAVHI